MGSFHKANYMANQSPRKLAFVCGGWYLALMHFIIGALWCGTIIGLAHFRLARQAFAPIGMAVVMRRQAHSL